MFVCFLFVPVFCFEDLEFIQSFVDHVVGVGELHFLDVAIFALEEVDVFLRVYYVVQMFRMAYFHDNLDNIHTTFIFSIFLNLHIHKSIRINNPRKLHLDKIINLILISDQPPSRPTLLLIIKPLMFRIYAPNKLIIKQISNGLHFSRFQINPNNLISFFSILHNSNKYYSTFTIHKTDDCFC